MGAMRAFFIAASVILSSLASATIYYASPGGDISTAGTDPANPTSIYKAKFLAAGDTLFLRGGTYTLLADDAVAPNVGPLYPHAGTSIAPVVIAAFPGEHPVVDGSAISSSRADKNAVGLNSYNVWDGIDIVNSINSNISVWANHDVVIRNVHSTGAVNAGILIGTSPAGRGGTPGTPATDLPGLAYNVTVEDCWVEDCCRTNASRTASIWTPALQVFQAHDLTIRRCQVRRCYGEGIGLRTAAQCTITDCVVKDSYSVNVYLDNCAYITLTHNLTGSTDSGYFRDSHAAIGFAMAVEDLPALPGGGHEAKLGTQNIIESNNQWVGSPGRMYYKYHEWDPDGPVTCTFSSTPIGIGGWPNIQNLSDEDE